MVPAGACLIRFAAGGAYISPFSSLTAEASVCLSLRPRGDDDDGDDDFEPCVVLPAALTGLVAVLLVPLVPLPLILLLLLLLLFILFVVLLESFESPIVRCVALRCAALRCVARGGVRWRTPEGEGKGGQRKKEKDKEKGSQRQSQRGLLDITQNMGSTRGPRQCAELGNFM